MANKSKNQYRPQSVSLPGETIQELLDELGMKQPELAQRMGLHLKTLNEIIKGKNPITPTTAINLERVLKVPAHFWLKREQQYREAIARQEDYSKLTAELFWLKELPIALMVKYGWVKKHSDPVEQLMEIYSFFAVASYQEWKTLWMKPKAAYSISLKTVSRPAAIATWLRAGELAAKGFTVAYNEGLFKNNLIKIRALTFENVTTCIAKFSELCKEAGVFLVFTPPIAHANVSGAVHWMGKTPIIQLSPQWKTQDCFWFTFFHEAAHLLLHGKKDYFIEGNSEIETLLKKEKEANTFAEQLLIDKKAYDAFTNTQKPFTKDTIRAFAQKIKVHEGIVVGRLQHDGKIGPNHFNDLQKKWTPLDLPLVRG